MPPAPLPVTDVAVAVVRDGDGRVLLAERTRGQVAAGFWELPGGKIDPGESPADAAARELREETGVVALALRPRITYEHAFPTKRVRLNFFAVDAWSGTPHGCEGQRLVWAEPGRPSVAPLLPSNARILGALALEAGGAVCAPARHADRARRDSSLHDALGRGARFVVLRMPQPGGELDLGFVRRATERAEAASATVLLAGSPFDARRAGAHGVLSNEADTHRMHARPNVPLWAATVSSTTALERAVTLGADLVVVPAPPGWGAATSLAERSPVPVFIDEGTSLTHVAPHS
jgi:8-oxo-dGTP diphosphatase